MMVIKGDGNNCVAALVVVVGACEGVCACSTCHVILEDDVFDALPEAEEKEEDMLDQAYGLTMTSRLSCQVRLAKEFDNMLVVLPAATRNFYVVRIFLLPLIRNVVNPDVVGID
jgi:ferredoxin